MFFRGSDLIPAHFWPTWNVPTGVYDVTAIAYSSVVLLSPQQLAHRIRPWKFGVCATVQGRDGSSNVLFRGSTIPSGATFQENAV